jgi:hypothetical protein
MQPALVNPAKHRLASHDGEGLQTDSEGTSAGTHGYGKVAPIPAIRVTGIEALGRYKREIRGRTAAAARPRDGASGRGKLRRARNG